MHTESSFIVYPEGEFQEIGWGIRVNALVDINGRPLDLPLPTSRMIAYRVVKVRREELKGETNVYHYLELVSAAELSGYVGG